MNACPYLTSSVSQVLKTVSFVNRFRNINPHTPSPSPRPTPTPSRSRLAPPERMSAADIHNKQELQASAIRNLRS